MAELTMTLASGSFIPAVNTVGMKDYIHYWWGNSDFMLNKASAGALVLQTKEQIMRNAASKFAKFSGGGGSRFRGSLYSGTGYAITPEQMAMADFIIDGTELPGLGDEEVMSQVSATMAQRPEPGVMTNFAAFRKALSDGSNYMNQLNALADSFAESSDIYEDVEAYVLSNVKNAATIESTSVQNILSQIMSKKDGTLFAAPSESRLASLSAKTQSLLVLLYSLGEGKTNTRTSRAVREYVKNMSIEHTTSIVSELSAVSGTVGTAMAMSRALRAVNDTVTGVFNQTVGREVEVRYTKSVKLDEDGNQWSKQYANYRRNLDFKSNDITTEVAGDDENSTITVRLGGVRNLTSVNKKNTLKTLREIHLTNSTNMLDALMGQDKTVTNKYTYLFQVAAAVPEDTDAGLDQAWSYFKEFATYNMIINSLVNNADESYNTMVKINDDVIPMLTFIAYLIDGAQSGDKNMYSTVVRGWKSRDYFWKKAAAQWIVASKKQMTEEERGSKYIGARFRLGVKRSNVVMGIMGEMMRQTKLDIRLNTLNMAALRGFVQLG